MSDTTENTRFSDLTRRVQWLEHERLTPYQRIFFLILQTVFPVAGAFALITSAALWIMEGPAQAVANVKMFVHITVALIMGISLLVWMFMTAANLVVRWRGDSPLEQ